ncbi:MAG: TetR/AcrR family transcriptional regulator [Solirubrobacteraceae bacterium]
MPPTGQRAPRLAPAERRRQIIEATLRVAEVKGFGALSIDAVAREAGITRPVVYDLFGDLRGLLAATLADAERRALATVQDVLPEPRGERAPEVVLADAFRRFLEAVRSDPMTWRLILLAPQGAPPQIRESVRRNRAAVAERVTELLEWGLGLIEASPQIDRAVLARLLIAAGEDMARLVLEQPRRYTPSRVARAVQEIALLLPDQSGRASRGPR